MSAHHKNIPPQNLSGADNFQMLLDLHIRRSGQAGNIVRLELRFEESADLQKLQNQLKQSEILAFVSKVYIQKKMFGVSKWKVLEGSDKSENILI